MWAAHTHGCDADQRGGNAGVQTPAQAVLGHALLDNVHGARVDALLGGLQAHLDQVKGVADDDGAHTTETARDKGPQLGKACGRRSLGLGLDLGLELLFALGDVGELLGDRRREGGLQLLVDHRGGGLGLGVCRGHCACVGGVDAREKTR